MNEKQKQDMAVTAEIIKRVIEEMDRHDQIILQGMPRLAGELHVRIIDGDNLAFSSMLFSAHCNLAAKNMAKKVVSLPESDREKFVDEVIQMFMHTMIFHVQQCTQKTNVVLDDILKKFGTEKK